MLDKKKIITMTRLSMYDKKYSDKDDNTTEFFRHDYVYKQNSMDRFFAILGGVIILFFYYGKRIFMGESDIIDMDFYGELRFVIIFFAVLLIVYTIIGSIRYNYQYTLSQRRQKKYLAMINQINKLSSSEEESKGASEF